MRTRCLITFLVALLLLLPSSECLSPVRAFQRWLDDDEGVEINRVALAASDERGWHVKSIGEIGKGEQLVAIPWSKVLRGSDIGDTQGVVADRLREQSPLLEEYAPEFLLFAKVLQERHKGNASEWQPYFAMLPTEFQTGLYFDEKDKACLSKHAQAHLQHLTAIHIAFLRLVEAVTVDTMRLKDVGFTDEELKWAFSVVFTRGMRSANNDALLVPYIDMLNHDGSGKSTVTVDFDETGVTLSAPENFPKGVELHLNYGDHLTASKLLVFYGFADTTALRVSANLKFPKNENTTALEEMDCYKESDLWISVETGEPSEKVLECVTLAILPLDNRTAYVSLDEEGRKQVLNDTHMSTIQIFGKHIEENLAVYPHKWDKVCDTDHHLIPLIKKSNGWMREVYLQAKNKIDAEVAQSAMQKVEMARKKRRTRRRKKPEENEKEEDKEL